MILNNLNYKITLIFTNEIRHEAAVSEPSSGNVVDEISPIRWEVAFHGSLYEVIISSIHRRVPEHENC